MTYDKKDFISTQDLTREQIDYILNQAMSFREINQREVKKVPTLKGRTIVNLFFEASTRTRTSFEIAGKRLGADVINISSSTSSTQKGETLMDTVKNIEAMASDIVVIRHSYSGSVKFVADNVDAHIVNAGDGLNEHPTQCMLDLLTIKLQKGRLEGLNVTIIGDIAHSRVARSDIWAMKTYGMNVTLFAPPTMLPVGVEAFDVNIAKKQKAKSDVMVMHPGPINRGVELSSVVADSSNSAILDQVENGVAVRMAVLSFLAMSK